MFGSRNKQSNLHGSGAWSSITLSLTLSVAAAMATVVSMSAEQLTELIQRVGGGAQQGRGGVGGEGGRGDEGEFEKFVGKQLDAKGFDGVGDFKGGEEGWGVWAWRMKVAVGAMHGDLASILVEAEGHEGKTVKELRADFADMGGSNGSRVDKASQELYSVLVRFTTSEAATIVRSTTSLDGAEAWGRLHANYSRRTMGRMFRVQRDCLYPPVVKDLKTLKLAIMQWEERWKSMMTELGIEAKIPELWKMSALLEICPKEVREQMLLKMDDIGENYEQMKNKIMSYTTNKIEQTRGGPTPMELDEVWDEDETEYEVDGVWRNVQCYACGEMGHMAAECPHGWGKGKGKAKGKDGGKGGKKGDGKKGKGAFKGAGKKGSGGKMGGKSWDYGKGGKGGKGYGQEVGYQWGYQGQCWKCGAIGHKANECPAQIQWVEEEAIVEGENEAEEDVGGVWMVGGVDLVNNGKGTNEHVNIEDFVCGFGCACEQGQGGERGPARTGGVVEVNVKSVEANAKDTEVNRNGTKVKAMNEGMRFGNPEGNFNGTRVKAMNEKMRSKNPEVNLHGIEVKVKDIVRKKVRQGERKKEWAARLGNRFGALAREEDEEMEINNVVGDEVNEVVEITIDSGAAKSVWPAKKKGVRRSKLSKPVRLAAANGSAIRVDGEAVLEFERGGRRCAMKFLDADVRRPLASVAAMVDEGNIVVFSHGESYVKNVVSGDRIELVRKNGVFVMELESGKPVKQSRRTMEVGLVEARAKKQEEEMVFYNNGAKNTAEDFSRQV